MKKRIIASLVFSMSMVAFAAQKPCSEVFPTESNVATSLGVDGSRCTVSKVTNSKGKVVIRVKVSKDNSSFVYAMDQEWAGTGKYECEDVGAGKIYECNGSQPGKEGEMMAIKGEKFNAQLLKYMFSGVSVQDKSYLFGGLPPWEASDY